MRAHEFLTESQLDEIDRRGFLKGIGAAAVGAAGVAGAGKAQAKGNWQLYSITGTDWKRDPKKLNYWGPNDIKTLDRDTINLSIKYYVDTNSIQKIGDHEYSIWIKEDGGPNEGIKTVEAWVNVKDKIFSVKQPSGWTKKSRVQPDTDVDQLIDKLVELGYR